MSRFTPLIAFLITAGVVGFVFTKFGGETSIPNPLITPPPSSPTPSSSEKCEALNVTSPKIDEKIKSPLKINATVDNRYPECRWTVFEAQAGTVEIKDEKGQILGSGFLSTSEEWMTENPVNYSGEIDFKTPTGNKLLLVITEENPSGQGTPQSLSIPLSY